MKTVLVHSGGLDSTVLLYHLLGAGMDVCTLSVNYGQRHHRELTCARTLADALGVKHQLADLSAIQALFGASSLTSKEVDIPDGHYAEETMKSTVVPNRNMILLAVATAWAISEKAETVSYAAHGGDHAIYPDCREVFANAMDRAMGLADWHAVRLERPFVGWTKADIVKRGAALNVPFEETWSCYKGMERHCGRCGTCVERREAFYLAGVADPTPYETSAPDLETMIAANWKLNPC